MVAVLVEISWSSRRAMVELELSKQDPIHLVNIKAEPIPTAGLCSAHGVREIQQKEAPWSSVILVELRPSEVCHGHCFYNSESIIEIMTISAGSIGAKLSKRAGQLTRIL